MADMIHIEIACAWPDGVYLREMRLPSGSTVEHALDACDLEQACPGLDLLHAPVGVHGRKVRRDHALRDGDRVEVYRPLRIDPMQARRLRARRGQG